MDDTDLAGPILFCLLFATFLLLVFEHIVEYIANLKGREKSLWIRIRIYSIGNHFVACHIKPHVSKRHQLFTNSQCSRLLLAATGINECYWRSPLTRVYFYLS